MNDDDRDPGNRMLSLWNSLAEREKRVLRERAGISTFEEFSQGSWAERFEITAVRIREIEAKALAKLRSRRNDPEDD